MVGSIARGRLRSAVISDQSSGVKLKKYASSVFQRIFPLLFGHTFIS